MKKSVFTNSILSVIQKCSNIIFPLITFPYLSRVLGATNYGKFSFSNSIISYFLLAAMLGVNTYAVREGARIRDDKERINEFVSEIFSLNIITLIISLFIYFVLICFNGVFKDYFVLLAILSFMLPSNVLGRDYINTIYEDYLYITLRYVVIHLLGVVSIYLFVKQESDYVLYTFIYMVTYSAGYILNLFYSRRYVPIKITKRIRLRKHLLPILILFCGQIAVTIYIQSDITMLGLFKSDTEVGIYSIASKVYILIKGIVNAVTTVTIPRIGYYLGKNDKDNYDKFTYRLSQYLLLLSVPLATGLFLMNQDVLLLVGGREYLSGGDALAVLSIALIFAVFSGFFCNALMVPRRNEKEYLFITVISACVNIGLNLFMIPNFGMLGAAITTLISELMVVLVSIRKTRSYFQIKTNIRNLLSIIIGGLIIAIICVLSKTMIQSWVIQLFVAIVFSGIAYFVTLILFRNELVIQPMLKILQKFKR